MLPLPLLFFTVRPYLQYGNIRSTTTWELGGRPVIDRRKHDLAMHQYLLAVDPGEQRAYVDPLQSEGSLVAKSRRASFMRHVAKTVISMLVQCRYFKDDCGGVWKRCISTRSRMGAGSMEVRR
jgi:hypothetical protein